MSLRYARTVFEDRLACVWKDEFDERVSVLRSLLQLQQQGIKGALVDSQNISADLLDAAGNPVAVLRPQHIKGFQDHQRKRSLQNIGLFFHRDPPLGFQQE